MTLCCIGVTASANKVLKIKSFRKIKGSQSREPQKKRKDVIFLSANVLNRAI